MAETQKQQQTQIINNITVIGAEHISKRFKEFIEKVSLEYPNCGLKTIIIDTEGKLDKFAEVTEEGVISLDLEYHLNDTLEAALEDQSRLSVRNIIWLSLMISVFHEIAHLIVLKDNPDAYPEGETEEIDEATTKEAEKMLYNYINKGHSVEPPFEFEMPYFKAELNKMIEDFKPMDDAWAQAQVYMAENLIAYYDKKEEITIMTLKEYLTKMRPDLVKDTPVVDQESVKEPTPKERIENEETKPIALLATGLEDPEVQADLDMLEATEDNEPEEKYTNPINEPEKEYNNPINIPPVQNINTGTPPPPLTIPSQNNQNLVSAGITAQAVYTRLYWHIFNTCGWTGTGFNNLQGIQQPIDITDIPGAKEMFYSMDIDGAEGKLRNIPTEGKIRGEIFRNSQLPGYTLHLNVNGIAFERRLVPQNPNKTDGAGNLSKTATRARAGEKLAWIINTETEDMNKKFAISIQNGIYTQR